MLLMIEKDVRGALYPLLMNMQEQYMKDYDKNKESSYLEIGM